MSQPKVCNCGLGCNPAHSPCKDYKPGINDIFKKFGFYIWLSKSETPDNQMPSDSMTLEQAKQAIYSLLASEAVKADWYEQGEIGKWVVTDKAVPLSKLKELMGIKE